MFDKQDRLLDPMGDRIGWQAGGRLPPLILPDSGRDEMPRTPNYSFERKERDRIKAEKKAESSPPKRRKRARRFQTTSTLQ